MEIPQEQEYLEWRQHPVTKAVFRLLWLREQGLKEQWASGAFTDQSQFGTAILNAKAIGNCEACASVRELDYVQLKGELEDDIE